VPTLSESGLPGFEAATWYGIYAPKGTDRAQLQWMLGQFNSAMADNAFLSRLVEQGYVLLKPEERGPEALAAYTRSEIEKWKKVIAAAAIPPN
jgi:tripartite-type tricarboxylate transporter receptor subunit TctC